jgi:hypothetical protein
MVNRAQCFQCLRVKANLRLSECCWRVMPDSWTCYQINCVPKIVVGISNDNKQGFYKPLLYGHSPPPTTFYFYLSPPLSYHGLFPPTLPFHLLPFLPFPSSFLPLPLPILSLPAPPPPISLPVEAGALGFSPGKIFTFYRSVRELE